MPMNSTIPNSKAGPCSWWSSVLHSLLIPAPRPVSHIETNKNFNPQRDRHSPGLIWKRILGHCLHCDLSSEESLGSLVRQRRRFVRLESLGLSGLILYEIPAGAVSRMDEAPARMTLRNVFGDPTDPSEHGMDVNDLLDGVNARVVYFPSYACTSFITGQVMSAFFQQQPLIRPLPAREGFSVDATAFINSSFTISANFTLESGESYSSTSMSSPASPIASTTSIPLIKVFPVDDSEDCFRDCFPIEAGSGVARALPIFGYNNFCSGCAEEGFENEFEAKISQDLSLATSNLGEKQLTGPLLGAVTLYSDCNGLVISHPSILSLVLDDYSEDGLTQYGTAEKDEDNTSLSTLDSAGPQTPPRSSSPSLSDLESEVASDDILNDAAPTSMRRRSGLASLDLGSLYETSRHVKTGSSPDISSPPCTLSSTSFVAGKTDLQEPLTPVTITFPGKQDPTPTHVRAPLANTVRLCTPAKVRSRIGAGKENIAPLTLRSRRG